MADEQNRKRFQVAYVGDDDSKHSMDVEALAPALLAFGKLIRAANAELNQKRATMKVLVDSEFEHKCFLINFETIARIQEHVMANIAGRHTLESLAATVRMSPRNFARHFVQETGITQHEFIERARIDAARMMLEGSDLPMKSVAYNCGFGSPDRMRIVFTARLGVTPSDYRASFRREELV